MTSTAFSCPSFLLLPNVLSSLPRSAYEPRVTFHVFFSEHLLLGKVCFWFQEGGPDVVHQRLCRLPHLALISQHLAYPAVP
jgi:hypothetical protein